MGCGNIPLRGRATARTRSEAKASEPPFHFNNLKTKRVGETVLETRSIQGFPTLIQAVFGRAPRTWQIA
jgi:hypothetical protein